MKSRESITTEHHFDPDVIRLALGLKGNIKYIKYDIPGKYNDLENDEIMVTTVQEIIHD